MKKEKYESGGGGFGLSTVFTIIFIVLKLSGTVKWSWLWVLSPTWIMLAIYGLLFIIVDILILIDKRKKKL